MSRIATFDDWIDLFREWRDDIGLDPKLVDKYKFEAKFDDLETNEIEFGDFVGKHKFERIIQMPDQRMRDGLLNLVVYQGDTEFASVEQQRTLVANAPTEYDLFALIRIMCEEMRHGYQMCHLLIEHFGSSGRTEAMKLLERRAFEQNRLLGSFNEIVDNWLDFFIYTEFIDRDGKFQLQMLSRSSFAPLARSMGPMLKEESFHLGTGHNGLKRILRAGKIPIPLIQKYVNKWVPTAYDLFGTDNSSSAQWTYVWGLKGRFNESQNPKAADRENLNEHARELYIQEINGLFDQLNKIIPEDQPKLVVPSVKFNRSIGGNARQPYDINGERLSDDNWTTYKESAFPTEDDIKAIRDICHEPGWIADK
jgi:1,2-phenylacetyl-CoA epoxidase catalytic subunit